MYAWQKHIGFVSKLTDGQRVELNPGWSSYTYLRREFGHLFPAMVNGHREADGIVTFHGKTPPFARQCLRPCKV